MKPQVLERACLCPLVVDVTVGGEVPEYGPVLGNHLGESQEGAKVHEVPLAVASQGPVGNRGSSIKIMMITIILGHGGG